MIKKAKKSVFFLTILIIFTITVSAFILIEIPKKNSSNRIAGQTFTIFQDSISNPRETKTTYYLKTEKKTFEIKNPLNKKILPNKEARITGKINRDSITLKEIKYEKAKTFLNPPETKQKIAVILLNSLSDTSEPINPKETEQEILNNSKENSISSYYQEVSYNKLFISGDTYGWYISSKDLTENQCSIIRITQEAINLADSDINFSNYNNIITILPRTNCPFSGVSSSTPLTFDTQEGIQNIRPIVLNGPNQLTNGVAIHEFGHSLGELHANLLKCGNKTLDTDCNSFETGDFFDIMGSRNRLLGHFNTIRKERLNWINSSQIIETTDSGIYEISPLETIGGIKTIKIPITYKNKNIYYYIEFRRALGLDEKTADALGEEKFNGAFVRLNTIDNGGDTQLLDLTPTNEIDFTDVVLKENNYYKDEKNNIGIQTLKVNPDSLKIKLFKCGDGEINLGEQCDDGNTINFDKCSNSCKSNKDFIKNILKAR